MKAKYQTRSPIEERVNLADVIPLSSPMTVVVEVASVCNLRCHFCPTGDPKLTRSTGKFRGLMDLDLFSKIVKSIDEFDVPIKTLHLHKDGEPLANPQFCDMVSIAKKSSNILRIETTTNGVLLNPALNRRLAECGLDRIKISVYGLSKEGFRKNTQIGVDFDQYVDNIADLYQVRSGMEIYIKILEEGLTAEEKTQFLARFGDLADTIFFEHCVDTWPDFNFDGKSETSDPTVGILGQGVRTYKKVCPQPFYNLTICADGKVTACCADWEVKLVVGDIANASLADIWNGKPFNDFRRMMLRGERRSHPTCGNCGYPTVTCVDDVDDAADILLKRFSIS